MRSPEHIRSKDADPACLTSSRRDTSAPQEESENTTMRPLLAISLMLCASTQALGCEKYNTPGVTLTGTVKIKTFYGPPNYGEQPATDSKEQQAILLLSKLLCTL